MSHHGMTSPAPLPFFGQIAPKMYAHLVRWSCGARRRRPARGPRPPQARSSPRCHRPWGWYETLALGPRFQVKRIMVEPGGQLSLQSHVHRAEHWVVVAGNAGRDHAHPA
jgi:hypothetical protein